METDLTLCGDVKAMDLSSGDHRPVLFKKEKDSFEIGALLKRSVDTQGQELVMRVCGASSSKSFI